MATRPDSPLSSHAGPDAGNGAVKRRSRVRRALAALALVGVAMLGMGGTPTQPSPFLRALVMKLTSYPERSAMVAAAKLLSDRLTMPSPASILPNNFPHAFLATEDDGDYDAILIKRGIRSTPTPFTENGKEYWEAYVCHNESCPGRAAIKQQGKGDRPYIFAAKRPPVPATIDDEAAIAMTQVFCPKCQEAHDKAAPKEKDCFDPTVVEHYMTEEAIKIIEKIREEYRRRASH